ncbi:MAG: hypothetical protein AAB569_04445, partial [Patescibacteria group bacterium]
RKETKEDLKTLEAKMVTKEDLVKFATKEDLDKFTTKEEIQSLTNELVELITSGFDQTEKSIERLSVHDEIIDNHEARIAHLELNKQ